MNQTADFPAAYRRLLWAYPRWYRRERAVEILTTLLDSTPPDRHRPGARDALNLVLGGLRCRFGLPRGRANRVVAAVAALFVGVAVSATAGLVTWRALPTVPTEAQAIAVAAAAVPLQPINVPGRGEHCSGICPDFAFDENLITRDNPLELNFGKGYLGDGGLPAGADPATGEIEILYRTAPEDVAALMGQAHERLAAAGWRFGETRYGAATSTKDDIVVQEPYNADFWAAKDDLVVMMRGSGGPIGDAPSIHVTVHHQAPGLVTVAAAVGLMLGALAGWLLTGWALRAYRRHRLWGRVLIAGTGMVGLATGSLLVLITAGVTLLLGLVQGWSAQDSLAPAAALVTVAPLTVTALVCLLACAVVAALAPAAGRTALPTHIPADRSPAR